MNWVVRIAIFLFGNALFAQTDVGLLAYFSFDDCTANESRGNTAVVGVVNGSPLCECGASGQALRLDGLDDHIIIAGQVNGEFNTRDFTISFYFKSLGLSGTQTLLKKVEGDCPSQNIFALRYDANTRLLNVQFVEGSAKSGSIARVPVPREKCWNHVALVRRSNKTQLFLNGKFAAEATATSTINIRNTGVLTIGESYCTSTDRYFDGMIDELRIYNRSLRAEEIEGLYNAVDQIVTPDTRIFLSESVPVDVSATCASQFTWTPATGVSDPTISNPVLTPTETTTYTLFFGGQGCPLASDTIRIVVIDPSTLSCEQVFLPKAFTPNGDNLNETYGISNPEIFTFGDGDLLSFEIYDRWGNLVFTTDSAVEQWDGSYKGEMLNPGVLLYKVRYTCRGEEKIDAGSLTLLR